MLDFHKPLVLVDGGNSILLYFMIQFWYRKAHPDEPYIQPWSQNPVFLDKYRTRYLDSITDMLKKFKTPISNVVIAGDDSRRNLFRTKKEPSYKADRVHDQELNKVLAIAYESIIPHILQDNDISTLSVRGLEADDVIACIARKAIRVGWEKVYILSADKDLSHLSEDAKAADKIEQWTLTKKRVFAKQSLFEHVILGDSSDNVPSCLEKGQGKKYLASLLENNAKGLRLLIEKDPSFAKKFKRNRFLIDFDMIPRTLRNTVEKKFLDLMFI